MRFCLKSNLISSSNNIFHPQMALYRFALMSCILSEKQGIAHGA